MLRIMAIFGTRPEAIKMAPLIKELQKERDIECIVCVTAQHREMLDQVLEKFKIIPQFDLNIMKASQTLAAITSEVVTGINNLIADIRPAVVLVHGDTTSSIAAALAAFYNKIPVGHVEAGLRTYDKYSPFPEEINRSLTAKISELHFAPTEINRQNLIRENIYNNIFVTGNTVIDALKYMVEEDYYFNEPILNTLCAKDYPDKHLILLTAHRRENWGEPLKNICNAIRSIVEKNKNVAVVYPLHLNPAVRKHVIPILSGLERVYLLEPLDVQDMHNLINKSDFVMTDSGGLQEEAPALNKPVIVLRRETERPEICEAGKAILAGTEMQDIYDYASLLLNDRLTYKKMQRADNPYGDGKASERIVQAIRFWSGQTDRKPEEFVTAHKSMD